MQIPTIGEDQASWDEFFIGLCIYWSQKSKDRSTKVGAVIVGEGQNVLATGFNGFPRGVPDDKEQYHTRPTKYLVTEHAERNAIYNAAREGTRLMGSTMYIPFEPVPCCDCARGIIQVGIKKIVGSNIKFTGKGDLWDEHLQVSKDILTDAGVKCVTVNVNDGLDIRNYHA